MINIKKMIIYKAFGYRIFSEIPLPELYQANDEADTVDIIIQKADLSALWCELADPQRKFAVQKDLVMFQVTGTGTFCIQEGKKIIVSPMAGADEDKIRLYILGSCMGALLMQRHVLPLHGSVIAIDGKAYAFVGERGAGKSTLASAFLSKGYQLLSDDVIAVSLTQDNIPLVIPSYPQQKLWQESLHQFGMDTTFYRPLFEREDKYAIPVLSKFTAEPLPLAGVFELVMTENEQIELVPIQGLERFDILFRHTFRNFLIARLGLREWHFRSCVNFVNRIKVFQLQRPTSSFTAYELASLILTTINGG